MRPKIKHQARRSLKSVNLRCTAARTVVLQVLFAARRPLTQQNIAAKLGPDAPDRVTIYRTLESLLKAGIVHKAYLQNRTWHFELAQNCTENQCHPHFTCTDCGTTHCMTRINLPMAKSPHKGFLIDRQQVRLEGLCPKCNPNL